LAGRIELSAGDYFSVRFILQIEACTKNPLMPIALRQGRRRMVKCGAHSGHAVRAAHPTGHVICAKSRSTTTPHPIPFAFYLGFGKGLAGQWLAFLRVMRLPMRQITLVSIVAAGLAQAFPGLRNEFTQVHSYPLFIMARKISKGMLGCQKDGNPTYETIDTHHQPTRDLLWTLNKLDYFSGYRLLNSIKPPPHSRSAINWREKIAGRGAMPSASS
jgi:hypothetical protein